MKTNVENLKEKVQILAECKSISELICTEVKVSHYETRLNIFKILFERNKSGSVKLGTFQEIVDYLKVI